jgi:hypothetical protein
MSVGKFRRREAIRMEYRFYVVLHNYNFRLGKMRLGVSKFISRLG